MKCFLQCFITLTWTISSHTWRVNLNQVVEFYFFNYHMAISSIERNVNLSIPSAVKDYLTRQEHIDIPDYTLDTHKIISIGHISPLFVILFVLIHVDFSCFFQRPR